MEKVGTLINRLQQQYSDKADESSLLTTALLLVTELQNNHNSLASTASKVSVIMPYKPFEIATDNGNNSDGEHASENENYTTVESAAASVDLKEEEVIKNKPESEEISVPEPLQTSSVSTLAEERYTDVMEHIPTLAQQQPKVVYELNDTAQPNERSINDKLKTETTETATKLQDEPIKDLRRAIGINDKYLFIKELFRNDEAAYERSIKTINSFHILPEAEYWIQREMIYKLGWDDNNPTVKMFYQLVRRRFS